MDAALADMPDASWSPRADRSGFWKDLDETSFCDQSVGHKPRHHGYAETGAHRAVGYEHVACADAPKDADRLIVERPVVEIDAGEAR